MKIIIDQISCDLRPGSTISLDYDAGELQDPEHGQAGMTLSVLLPQSVVNDAVFAFAGDPHAAHNFNDTMHTARLMVQGSTLLCGTARLLRVSNQGYTVELRSGAAGWAKVASVNMFNQLPIDYTARLTPTEILNSWSGESPVRFLPVVRDRYEQQNSSSDLLTAEHLLSVDDYHPFLHVATLLKRIFSQAGYQVQSRLLETEEFRSLYMSGAYATHDTTAADSRMGFRAQRLATTTALADNVGRIYATPFGSGNIVGNIVQTATPQSLDEQGTVLTELYNNGGCFGLEQGKIIYRPLATVSVAFEYYIKYTTDHRILTRTRLKGIDGVNLGAGSNMPFALANRYVDRRESLAANYQYLAIVFDHTPGAEYRLLYTLNGSSGRVWTQFSARTATIVTPPTGSPTQPHLQIKSGSNWIDCDKDWALYDGYITERGRTTVELCVTTAPEILSPTQPKQFNTIYFYGAEEQMSFTLHSLTRLRARFTSHPGYGAKITFADLAQHRVRQTVFLSAIQHLFNLRFLTDEQTKTVYIEPYDELYQAEKVIDWREKIDLGESVECSDLALEVHKTRLYGYIDGQGAVARFDAQNHSPLGQWRCVVDSCAALEGVEKITNPLFTPTLSATACYTNAPSAQLMQVGDRDALSNDGCNFSPRIVRYLGMKALPEGERWGYPWGQASYPFAAFHSAECSLCFEDRDGQQGLHRYYDRQVEQQRTRQRIVLTLRLLPCEVEQLMSCGSSGPDMRAIYLLTLAGETVRCTLRRVADYNPQSGTARCTFIRCNND